MPEAVKAATSTRHSTVTKKTSVAPTKSIMLTGTKQGIQISKETATPTSTSVQLTVSVRKKLSALTWTRTKWIATRTEWLTASTTRPSTRPGPMRVTNSGCMSPSTGPHSPNVTDLIFSESEDVNRLLCSSCYTFYTSTYTCFTTKTC